MAKKDLVEKIAKISTDAGAYNPLMTSLRENDKRNLFNQSASSFFHKTGFPLFDYYFGSVINLHNEIGEITAQEPRVGQSAGTFNMFVGNTGTGKALRDDTLIPTPSGPKQMSELMVGDMVFGPDGLPTKVVGVYPQGSQEVWEVLCDNDMVSYCTSDHLWQYNYRDKGADVKCISTTEKLLKLMEKPSPRKPWLERLSAPLQFTEQPVPIHPAIFGRCIGSENFYKSFISMIDGHGSRLSPLVLTEMIKLLPLMLDKHGNPMKSTLVELIESVKASNTIPDVYRYNSIKNRAILLCAILDRGHIELINHKYHCTVRATLQHSSVDLLMSIRSLLWEMGENAVVNYNTLADTYSLRTVGDLGDAFQSMDTHESRLSSAITLAESENKISARDDRAVKIFIKSVTPTGVMANMTCIKVAREDGLFITEHGMVTHNTTLVVQIAANIIRPYKEGMIVHYDYEQRFSVTRGENISKLPISDFEDGGRYILQQGMLDLESTQQAIVQIYVKKIQARESLLVGTGKLNEFGKEIFILPPTVVILDSVANIIPDGFSVDNAKDVMDSEKLRSNMAGARDAKTMRGFMRDIAPLLKEANIIVYAINHINASVQINMFAGPQKQMNFLKPEESIPGGKALFFGSYNLPKLTSRPSDDFNETTDGFNGHMVMVEPIKSSSNQSGNNSKGVAFDLVFSYKHGFDSLRSLIMYGKEKGIIDGTKPRFKFVDDPSFTFAWKSLDVEKNEKPIWECVKKYIIPELNSHLSFVEPLGFDDRTMDY